MLDTLVMVAGGVVWLAGELYAVYSGEPTTSWYVRSFQRRWPLFHVGMIVFLAWLVLHFEAGLP